MKILPFIESRISSVSFQPAEISDEQIRLLFLAASRAPSSYNQQPWRFVYSRRGTDDFNKYMGILSPANQQWAVNAGLLVLSFAETILPRNGKPNFFAFHDLGLATQNLLLQAESMGLHSHVMGGYDAQKASELAGIPEGFTAAAMIAVGHPGGTEDLPEPLLSRQTRRSGRNDFESFCFEDRWNNTK